MDTKNWKISFKKLSIGLVLSYLTNMSVLP